MRLATALARLALAILVPAASACSDGAPAGPQDAGPLDGGDGRDGGAADGASTTDAAPTGPTVGLLVTVSTPNAGGDVVKLLRLGEDGLSDPSIEIPIGGAPRELAFRGDGREAIATFAGGTVGTDKGVLVLDVEPDGSAASLQDSVALGTEFSPNDVVYITDDEALLAMRGPGDDHLLPLVRSGGTWELGPAGVVGEGPLVLHRLDDDHALLLRADMIYSQTYEVLPIGRQPDGAWLGEAPAVPLGQFTIEMVLHPSGRAAYVPLDNLADAGQINPRGELLRLVPASEPPAWRAGGVAALDHTGSQIALSLDGRLAVLNDPVAVADPLVTGGVRVDEYQLVTIDLDEDGVPGYTPAAHTRLRGAMIDDFTFAPTGALVVAWTEKASEATGPTPYPIQAFTYAGDGRLEPLGERLYLAAPSYALAFPPPGAIP